MGQKIAGWLKKRGLETGVVLLCIAALCAGIGRKQGFHMDEMLSFELSNAEFNPWIVPTQPQGRLAKFVQNEIRGDSFGETVQNLKDTALDVIQNRGGSRLLSYEADVYEEPVWIGRDVFRDYITVGDGDAFNYLSVYFNVKDDNHPPLYFMLLHTISSIFRGSAEPFVGCIVNLAAAAGILILLIRTGKILAASMNMEKYARAAGLAAALLYGLSAGALASVLLIRMYALLTFFCVAFFAVHVEKWRKDEWESHNKLLILTAVLGFLTQYFFLFYCILLAAVTAVMLLTRRKYRAFWIYARSMAAAGAAGLLLFPFAVQDVFSSGRGVEALQNLAEGAAGYGGRLASFFAILADGTFGWKLVLGAVVFGVVFLALKRKKEGAVWRMLLLPTAGYFFLAARMSPYLVDRYIMPLFPFAALSAALLIFWLMAWLEQKGAKRIGYAACAFLILWQAAGMFRYDGSYFYKGYALQEAMAEEYAEMPCICVYEGVGYYENLPEFTFYEKTLLVKPGELAERKDRESIAALDEVVVLVKPGADWAGTAEVLEEIYGFCFKEWLFRESAHGDLAGIFVKVK